MSVAAEPASGSEIATAIDSSPLTMPGRYFCFSASLPRLATTWAGPVLDSKTWNAAGRQTLASSSIATSASRIGAPEPPYSSGSAMPSRPREPRRSRSSRGNGVRFSSHSCALGP